jgi:carbonic anhydrase/acetyltransferase-like protein (isoleucine patch superfamily)
LKSNIIDDGCVVGENCLLLEGARMERGSSLANNSTLLQGVVIPSGQHWEGNPATYKGDLDSNAAKQLR